MSENPSFFHFEGGESLPSQSGIQSNQQIHRFVTPKNCDPKEIALKSFFLGPQAENANWVFQLLESVFVRWVNWRKSIHPEDGRAISSSDQKTPAFIEQKNLFEKTTMQLLSRLEKEVPKFSPRYIGHMFSETSLPALFGHIVTLLHNPNNISAESSLVGTELENEAIESLLEMVGFMGSPSAKTGAGHFTSGGTVANLESMVRSQSRMALWMAAEAALRNYTDQGSSPFNPFLASHMGWEKYDELLKELHQNEISLEQVNFWKMGVVHPKTLSDRISEISSLKEFLGPVVLVPENKHYSWKKGVRLLGLGMDALWPVELDHEGALSISHLKTLLEKAEKEKRPVMQVVSVVGTTELGGIDPVHRVQEILDQWKKEKGIHIWHHVDAAYGGYFRTISKKAPVEVLSRPSQEALNAMAQVESITLDPHKLGYVPYASGAFLTHDQRDYYFSTFDDAPYIDFDRNHDRGPYTIEGSRSAAGAIATWMTAKTMGFDEEGYGLLLERTIKLTKKLSLEMATSLQGLVQIAPGGDTNILCFTCAKKGESLSVSNERTLKVFEAFSPRNQLSTFTVSKTALSWKSYQNLLDHWTSDWEAQVDQKEVVLIRMTLMNPFISTHEMNLDCAQEFLKELKELLQGNASQ